MFIFLGIALALILGGCSYFQSKRVVGFYMRRFCRTKPDDKTFRRRQNLISAAIAVIVALCCVSVRSVAAMAALYLVMFFAIADLVFVIIKALLFKNKAAAERVRAVQHSGIIPFAAACLVFCYGIWNMGQVVQTSYTVKTDKNVGDGYTVVLLTDIHYGTVRGSEQLVRAIDDINALSPDAVILGGDIVEEGTTAEAMREAFELLGSLKAKHGVYFVYGNHDKQSYSSSPYYTVAELKEVITQNGITVLEDEAVMAGDLLIAGRADAARSILDPRCPTSKLIEDADSDTFVIVADHQPVDFDENRLAGVDLQLSGHTHAGQVWPLGLVLELFGYNYGSYTEDGCELIVSSGVTGWGFHFRTQGKCEYVVVNIQPR